MGVPIFSFGTHTRANPVADRSVGDGLLAAILGLALTAALLLWMIVVVPLQYFVFLFCEGPARYFVRSRRRSIARLDGYTLAMTDLPKEDSFPEGWWDASIIGKPVTVTGLLSSLVLLVATWMAG